ncbi:MAG: T9SS type A sorting domain-containing protein [Bacteroidia bacterium]|nr:T9SS type A sorting domain-containing protein [Bacteroidia bacterium]
MLHGCLKTDDGYIITGDTGKYVYSPAFVASFDFDFNLKWLKVYTFQCRYTSILKSNTGYFLSGIKDFDGAQRISQVGIDSIGNIIWERNYLDTSYYISGFLGQGVKINNKYFSYGFTSNSTNLNEIGYLNASNEDGNLLFEKFYPMQQNFSFRKMIEYNNSLYAIAALDSLINNVTFTRFVQFSKISAETGNIEWYQLYKHYSRNNEIHNLYKVDNGFLMCGNAVNQNRLKEFDSTHRIESDAWLLKVDTNGCIIPGCKPYVYSGVQHILHDNAIIEVYPNPVGEYFTITFKNQQLFNGSNEIFIYDMAGRELFNQTLKALTSSIKLQNTFNYSGAAFLVIKNDAGMFYKKIIFQ